MKNTPLEFPWRTSFLKYIIKWNLIFLVPEKRLIINSQAFYPIGNGLLMSYDTIEPKDSKLDNKDTFVCYSCSEG